MLKASFLSPFRLAFLTLSLAVFLGAAPAAPAGTGVAGKWSGTVDVHDAGSGTTISTPIEMRLEEPAAGGVAGKIGREGETDSVSIRNAKLEGGQLTFDAGSAETTGSMKFTLALDGDRLDGQMKGTVDTQEIEGKVKLTRQKN